MMSDQRSSGFARILPQGAGAEPAPDHARAFLHRVLPWAPLGDADAYVNIHWTFQRQGFDRPAWGGRAVKTIDQAIKAIEFAQKSPDTKDIYVCMSTQREAQEVAFKTGNGSWFKAIRSQENAVQLRSLYLDIDVKPDAYPTTQAAIIGLAGFLKASGMPKPTMVVASGSGGLHVYWSMSEALTLHEWQPLAQALAEAARRHGLHCDSSVTVDGARVLRIPGTLNHKSNPPNPVVLGVKTVLDYTYPVDQIRQVLTPYFGAQVIPLMPRMSEPGINDDLSAGLTVEAPPVDFVAVAAECAFIREALETGGAGFAQPLWNLTTLIATFVEDGRAMAHRMSQGHTGYLQGDTDALYERKLKERAAKDLGWPKCASIQNAGCTSCAACAHLQAGLSPLHLGRARYPLKIEEASGAEPHARLRTLGVADLPASPPPREWMYNVDAIRRYCSLVVSPGGRGKSSFLIAMGLACATNREILGEKVHGGPQSVLYLNTEDGTEEVSRRLRAAQKHFQLTDAECKGLRVAGVDLARVTLLKSDRSNHVIDPVEWEKLRALLHELKPDLLILDPLANLSAHTLNDNSAATALMSGLTRLAVEFNMAIVIAHHSAKGRDLGSQEAAMGASAIVNSARVVLSIETLAASDAGKIGVMPSDAGSFFRLTSVKANLAKASADDRWFQLIGVSLGNGTVDYPAGDRVQVVERFRPGSSASRISADLINGALRAIQDATPPLSDKKQARDRWAVPVIAAAVEPLQVGKYSEADAQAILSHLQASGLVDVCDVVLERGRGRTDTRKGLVLTAAGEGLLRQDTS